MPNIRTDLAMEANELWQESSGSASLPGVISREEKTGNFLLTTVEITDRRGAEALGKPCGRYLTLELDALLRREQDAFCECALLLGRAIRQLLPSPLPETILVAGLGNPDITPDAVGPRALDSVMVTRHLKEHLPQDFAPFRSVAALRAGVLGTTGLESADILAAVAGRFSPAVVIAVDALASRRLDRLCRTIQISDTGIVPGSGVGNSRAGLNADTLGVPVIAVGVPTVVDAVTLALDLAASAGRELGPDDFSGGSEMIVTPRDIDRSVADTAKLIGYGIDLALHDGLTVEDVDMFLS